MELELAAEHDKVSGGVTKAVEIGAVDEIVEPKNTRTALARALAAAPNRRGSHGNIPL
jgi:acetyl-CoA/propionyl-CoA carboxylase carboxyl transferase subunit